MGSVGHTLHFNQKFRTLSKIFGTLFPCGFTYGILRANSTGTGTMIYNYSYKTAAPISQTFMLLTTSDEFTDSRWQNHYGPVHLFDINCQHLHYDVHGHLTNILPGDSSIPLKFFQAANTYEIRNSIWWKWTMLEGTTHTKILFRRNFIPIPTSQYGIYSRKETNRSIWPLWPTHFVRSLTGNEKYELLVNPFQTQSWPRTIG